MIDPLTTRYATPQMVEIWTPQTQTRYEHALWIAAMQAQADRGLDITPDQLADYRKTADAYTGDQDYRASYDLAVAHREQQTRHETKARLDIFDEMSGRHGRAHLGLTSCDITEAVAQIRVAQSAQLLGQRSVAALRRLAGHAQTWRDLPIVARTHNQPAQVTTLGKRFAGCAEELLRGFFHLRQSGAAYPVRGLKGAVGTMADLAALYDGDHADVRALSTEHSYRDAVAALAGGFRPGETLDAIGQNYPRAYDHEIAACAVQLCHGPASLALTLRLMSGHELVEEKPTDGQVGSSAMPHKHNPRFCERIAGLQTVARGYAAMLGESCGNMWNEGDVADSAVRRIALPGVFLAVDGLLRTFAHVLDRLAFNTPAIARELHRHAPELATGRLLAAAVRAGANRETAHAAIRAATADRPTAERLASRLSVDTTTGLTFAETCAIVEQTCGPDAAGLAAHQIDSVVARISRLSREFPDAEIWDPAVTV